MSSSCEEHPILAEGRTLTPRRTGGRQSGIRILTCALVLFAAFAFSAQAQQRVFTVPVHSAADSVIALPDNFLDFRSLRVQLDSSLSLVSIKDFAIDTATRTLHLTDAFRGLMFGASLSQTHLIRVTYNPIELQLKPAYALHQLDFSLLSDSLKNVLDSAHRRLPHLAATQSTNEKSDLFSNFQKSGSISRGFQAGSNRDLSLTSGFNLQFSGDLAKDVNVTGALTEETTPIQPEGTTQTINDIDRVFIKVRAGEHFDATLGDFFLDLNSPTDPSRQFEANSPLGISSGRDDPFKAFSQSTFDVISRKLLGVEAHAQFANGSVLVSGAATRGKYNTSVFQGQEAFQGPYRLSGKNGERAIIIIAGTERVYVDGALQTRGEKNDYIIDYALGEIRFQPRRLITSESRITIDFEYSDQQYSRSLLAANGRAQLLDGAFTFSTTYLREGDNQDAPLDLTLSDTDRTILAHAGSNPYLATKSAVTYSGRDAQGRAAGSYARIDSSVRFYRYDPLDTVNALYNIAFGHVGAGRGQYQRLSIGQFQYVGAGAGDYDTLRMLPLPQLNQVIAFNSTLRISKHLGLTGEFANSAFTPNRFADINTQADNAYRAGALFADTIPIIGYAELKLNTRHIGLRFNPIDRIQDVEFERRYGNDRDPNAIAASRSSEDLREASALYRPVPALTLEGGYGSLKHSEFAYASQRLYGRMEVREDSAFLPHTSLALEYMPTEDSATHERSVWHRLFADASKSIAAWQSALTIGGKYGTEEKRGQDFATAAPSDSLHSGSFRYRTLGPNVQLRLFNNLSIGGEYAYRTDDSTRNGLLTTISQANTSRITVAVQNLAGFSSTIDLTVRNKHYTDSLSSRLNGGDQSTLLLRFEPKYLAIHHGISIEALYEISNQRAARLERVFLPVPKGLGNYYYIGDVNHNGRADESEFAPARYLDEGQYIAVSIPTEALFPTTDLRSSARLRISPSELFGIAQPTAWMENLLSSFNSETDVKLEETSRDENASDIYFFHLSHFRNDSTTVHGLFEFEQDFNILENDPNKSFRLHYLERANASQYNTGLERTFFAERTLRARFRPAYELSTETTLGTTTDQADADSLSVVRPHNTSIANLTSDWSYHPTLSALNYGLRLELGRAVEHGTSSELSAILNAITLRTSYALEARARLRAELERDELDLQGPINNVLDLPYSLTSGRALGITWIWKLALDYQFGSGIIATLSYDGRNSLGSSLGNSNERITVHNARAEVRANF